MLRREGSRVEREDGRSSPLKEPVGRREDPVVSVQSIEMGFPGGTKTSWAQLGQSAMTQFKEQAGRHE